MGARRWALRATAATKQIRLGHISPAAAVIEAWARSDADPAQAAADASAAMDEIDAEPTSIAATMFRSLAAEARWRAGDIDGAAKELDRARADVEERGERFWLSEVLRLQAEVAAASGGAPVDVAGLLDEAVAVAEAQGEPPLAARAREARQRLAG